MKEIDCRKCCVSDFKHDLCEEDFCEKYYREGSAKDFEKLLPHWIPVSERLPEESGFYYVSVINMHGRAYTKCVHYNKRSNYWFAKQEIVAWMPKLEPYKGENE